MPTDLPPDYKPEPVKPGDGKRPDAVPNPPQGDDVKGGEPPAPNPGGRGLPGPAGDVVDPPGWKQPVTTPGTEPAGVPTPAGTPVF